MFVGGKSDDQDTHVTVVSGAKKKKKYSLSKSSVLIGRGDKCDIVFTDPKISPIHALLQKAEETYIIVTKGDVPIEVNGRVRAQAVLADGDTIKLGDVVLSYSCAFQPSAPSHSQSDLQPSQESNVDKPDVPGAKNKLLLPGLLLYLAISGLALGAWYWYSSGGDNWRHWRSLRIEQLETARKSSKLDNRDEICEMALEAIRQTKRIEPGEIHRRLNLSLELTIPTDGSTPYEDKSYVDDPLRRIIISIAQDVDLGRWWNGDTQLELDIEPD
jgi:hypothetical protein